MNETTSTSPLVLFIRLSRPLFLLGGILLYALGTGIARYLGTTIDWTTYLLGQGVVTMLQLSGQYLNEYYDVQVDRDNPNRTPFTGGSGVLGETGLPRSVAFMAAAATLTVTAVLSVLLYRNHLINFQVLLILVLAVLGTIFYSVPPVRLASSGYGELTTSIVVANLVPTFAFLLQTGELHRLLALITFPLTALHLAMLIAFSFPDYATDLKYQKRTLLVRIGWQKTMTLHNILIGTAYLLLALGIAEGLPIRVIWPGFLTLPLGIFQIWQMNQIAAGAPPRWTLLTFTALALFGLTAYFLAFAFWVS